MASTSPDFTFLRQLRGAPTTLTMKQLVRNYCASDSLQDRLIQELGWRKAMSIKEILEAYEFFARVRFCLRALQVADVCCGHGLVGLLFALFERDVERVALIDKRRSKSHALVLEAAVAAGRIGRALRVGGALRHLLRDLGQHARLLGHPERNCRAGVRARGQRRGARLTTR